jgi:hypothetical protein
MEKEAVDQKCGSGGGSHSISRGGEDCDPMQQSQKNRKMRIESIGVRSHVRKRSRTRNALCM